jgi:methyl-galactoside transport system ATP-binding protein
MPDETYLLEMRDICKEFPGVKALDRAQLKVRRGTVHALMGENGAGKSTLMRCLFGIYIEDSGDILLESRKVNFTNPRQALENGVAMVHQELNQVLMRNVMDNLWLGRYPRKWGVVIDYKKMYDETKKIFTDLNMDIDPRMKIGKLPVAQRQMAEIAKAVSFDAKLLVLDEPTSSLMEKEVQHLFEIIRRLKERGWSIIYISHKIEEILAISDEVTVMRDGKWVATTKASELTVGMIIRQMVGRDLTQRFPDKTNKPGEVVLQVRNITAMYQPSVRDVSFDLRSGEVLGVAGLLGSRRTELLENIFGSAHRSSGAIFSHGKPIRNVSPKESIRNGFAMLTEERRATGIFAVASVSFNATIANMKKYTHWGMLSDRKAAVGAKWVIDSMRVKTPSQKTLIKSLSGGNQQKVILGRWLLTKPEILLLDEPTRGIDVGAKFEIYQLINSLASEGKGVIVVSSEMPELIGITDRMLVMSNGRLAGIVNTKETTQEEIMELAAKYL